MKSQKGFSVIELIVVITIVAMLMSVAILGWRGKGEKMALERSVHQLSQDIRKVQELTMRAEDFQGTVSRGGFGIQLQTGTSSYILFADVNENRLFGSPELLENRELEEGVTITSIAPAPLSPTTTITFIPPDPAASINNFTATSVTITLGINGLTRNIIVNDAGLIAIE